VTEWPIFSKTLMVVIPTCLAVPVTGLVVGAAVAFGIACIVFGRAA
jgi:hypothetical protein